MRLAAGKIYTIVNPLLGLLAVFNIVLTLYCCTQFYAYLPTSDTWAHVDFLVAAAKGHLDFPLLFEKHNGIHTIVLPKLVYFLDMRFTQGSGVLTVAVSLLAQLVSAGIFILVIRRIKNLSGAEKFFIGSASIITLLSASQVESLLNPANLQWSLLVFAATLTAWFLLRYVETKSSWQLFAVAGGVVLVGLTSASMLLAIIPSMVMIGTLYFGKLRVVRATFIMMLAIPALIIGAEIFRHIFAPQQLPAWLAVLQSFVSMNMTAEQHNTLVSLLNQKYFETYAQLLINWISITFDFYFPPMERIASGGWVVVFGIGICCFLLRILHIETQTEKTSADHTKVFFGVLLLIAMTVIAATATVRVYDQHAFTFRFVNIGLLFSLNFLILVFLYRGEESVFRVSSLPLVIFYIVILSYVNFTEASVFGYGRNHVRLNQVAYSLDIQSPSAVSALPGTSWEKLDFEIVQSNKNKLKEVGVGIYSDEHYQRVGKPVSDLMAARTLTQCTFDIYRNRRLLEKQAAYKLVGASALFPSGTRLSRIYFVDQQGIIRGSAIPVMSARNLWKSWQRGKDWAGFVNLDSVPDQKQVWAYAYDDGWICKSQPITLPPYLAAAKKGKNSGMD